MNKWDEWNILQAMPPLCPYRTLLFLFISNFFILVSELLSFETIFQDKCGFYPMFYAMKIVITCFVYRIKIFLIFVKNNKSRSQILATRLLIKKVLSMMKFHIYSLYINDKEHKNTLRETDLGH